MAENCCKLVGNLDLNLDGCIISVNVSSRAEVIRECGSEVLLGPSVGTVSITGYAVPLTGNPIHIGCPGRAGVSIPWVRRYDCDSSPQSLYLISSGQGTSYVAGEVNGLASLVVATGRSYPSISASAQSGPATIYMETSQEEGYGLDYNGGPISFDTRDNNTTIIDNFGVGEGSMYLQNFSLELNPGEIPTASYSFMFVIND